MDNKSLILNNIGKWINLTEAEADHFTSLLKPVTAKRKELILEAGEICRYSYFVTSGCLRGYTIDANGFEHVLNFAAPNWWIADMYSLLSQRPGNTYIQALEPTSTLALSKDAQERLYREIPAFERFFRIITENSLVSFQQRLLDNLSLTAEERYQNFCKRYAGLTDSIPAKQVASYIGVTPEFLSKMKHKLLYKK
ncbi:Crp/Fnr family transcriptional regulator [Olivibacter sp. XZL3]|uniref:Crp/Fnr family transcriptional regulator n=1 Tax=Olivibacter sp. XZL3 TaxID=1735116 RepID=UPI001065C682|nr:Crp/Fnr family transcriptional regulator [Olivibacter sp. XZL3]